MQEEMTIGQLFFLLLRKWRFVLIVTVVTCALFGLFGGAQAILKNNDLASPEAQTEYARACTEHIAKRENIENQLSKAQDDLQNVELYVANSMMMAFDPYSKYIYRMNISVNTGYTIDPNLSYQTPDNLPKIVLTYIYSMRSPELYNRLNFALNKNMQVKYWNEVFAIKDLGNGLIELSGIGNNEDEARIIVETLWEHLQNYTVNLQNIVGQHTVSKLGETFTNDIDPKLDEAQKDKYAQIDSLLQTITSLELQLNKLQGPVIAEINASKIIVKYSLIGLICGLFIASIIVFFWAFICPIVTDEKVFQSAFNQRVLGELLCKNKLNIIDTMIDSLHGVHKQNLTVDATASVVVENLWQLLKDKQIIIEDENDTMPTPITIACVSTSGYSLLCSNIHIIAERAAQYNINLIVCQDLRFSVDSIKQVGLCKYVLLFERCMHAQYDNIEKEIYAIQKAAGVAIGIVLMD